MVKDMTEGNIFRHLAGYTVPLILGNLFQLTYNAVDSIIVGRFIGKEALAAVGTSSPVMNIIILGISGICIGSSVLMSSFFGGKQEDMVKKEMATTAVFGVYFSLIVVAVGMAVTRPLLRALYVPEEILDTACAYLRIIFLGAPFTFFYNAVASALKSVGDSKTPLKFLAFCSVLNGVLDVIFIGYLHFGIICSAVTTVVAEALSAILCILYVYRKIPLLQLAPGEFKVDRGLLRQTLQYGSVTALQQSCQPVGKLLIQGAVNPMGVDVMAAFNAVNKIDAYAFTPEQSISNAITTFVAQNSGAGEEERIRKGFGTGMMMEFGYWILICGTILLLRGPLMRLFVGGEAEDIVALGSEYLGIMAFFYLFPGFTNGMQGYFRGRKHMKMTLFGTFIQTSLRVVFVYVLTPVIGLSGVAFACAVGWALMLAVEVPYYFYITRAGNHRPLGRDSAVR
ncbi:MAG: MATE family efflux transporter [Hungatella sp.]|nr:MATE family efflux transporter [Hungatella sp.]